MDECNHVGRDSKITKIEDGIAGTFIYRKCLGCDKVTGVKETDDAKIKEAMDIFKNQVPVRDE